MKKYITIILSFLILPYISYASETVKISRTGNSYTSGDLMKNVQNNDVVELTNDMDTFTFNSNSTASNITIDLKGHSINNMFLYGTQCMQTGSDYYYACNGNTTWTITDSGNSNNNKGSIKNLTIGGETKSQTSHPKQTNMVFINNINFSKGSLVNIQKDKYESVFTYMEGCTYPENDVISPVPVFINNAATLYIKSGTYNNVRITNSDTLQINNGTFNGVVFDNDSYGKSSLTINNGEFSDISSDGTDYLIKNSNELNIKGGNYTLNSDYLIYNVSGSVKFDENAESKVTVASNSKLFYFYAGNATFYNGNYTTTTENEAFNFYTGTIVTFVKGTIEAKDASGGKFSSLIYGDGSVTDTNPLIDLRKGILQVDNSYQFKSGNVYVKTKAIENTIDPVAPEGYKVIYEPTENLYYTAKLATLDTPDPGSISEDVTPTITKGDWNGDNEFSIDDIFYYRKYLAGVEEPANNQLYDNFDIAKKEALNYDENTNITILDLVQARVDLAGVE